MPSSTIHERKCQQIEFNQNFEILLQKREYKNMKRTEAQTMAQDKMFANHASDKVLASTTYKGLSNLTI
jgi:hypothetical protein